MSRCHLLSVSAAIRSLYTNEVTTPQRVNDINKTLRER